MASITRTLFLRWKQPIKKINSLRSRFISASVEGVKAMTDNVPDIKDNEKLMTEKGSEEMVQEGVAVDLEFQEITQHVPDWGGHASQWQVFEYISKVSEKNPYDIQFIKMETKEGWIMKPYKVPTVRGKRLVGCLCDEDIKEFEYTWLTDQKPVRCECGFWFKLTDEHEDPYSDNFELFDIDDKDFPDDGDHDVKRSFHSHVNLD